MCQLTAVLGVDGCPGGWIGALVTRRRVRWLLLADAAAVVGVAEAAVTAVDIPIGLPEAGRRACDSQARRLLGRRGCTVFDAPVRPVLAAADYAEACRISLESTGRSMSRQAWNLVARIRDVDTALGGDPWRLVETHPELAFLGLAGGELLASKHTPAGAARRASLLAGWLPGVAGALGEVPRPARQHDALDALACAWVADRIRRGAARPLPDPPELDRLGRPMRIVC